PVVRGQKGEFKDFFADMLKRGYVRARVDGQVVRLTDDLKLDKRIKHDIAIVIDRLKNEPRIRPRLAEAVEQALALAEGSLLIPDPAVSFYDGAIPLVGKLRGMGRWRKHIFEGVAKTLGIDLKTPFQDLPTEHRDQLLNGSGDRHITYEWKQRGGRVWKHGGTWEGVIPQLLSSFKKTAAGPRRMQLEKYMRSVRCPACQGQRLNPQARAGRVPGKTLIEVCALPVSELAAWVDPVQGPLEKGFDTFQRAIAGEVLKEI